MSARQNLKLKCLAMGIKSKAHIDELLDVVRLNNVGKKPIKKYSLGMKQHLGIALALVGYPDLVILDEPINGLDPQGMVEFRGTISFACRICVFYCTCLYADKKQHICHGVWGFSEL